VLSPDRTTDRRRGVTRTIWLTLWHRWADGTTHLRIDLLELLERLAALMPRPRVNLILDYGVLAPRAAGRSAAALGASAAGDGCASWP
jgi:hypothetical protein